MNKNEKIIYIVGTGHSGSTILQLALATNSPYIFPIGELYSYLMLEYKKRRKKELHLCDCGLPVTKCPFWSRVFNPKNTNIRLKKYDDVLHKISKISKRQYIVDSSKWVPPLYFLKKRKKDVYVIFLIRDGRGVLWSYYKKYKKTLRHIIFWMIYNIKITFHLAFSLKYPKIKIIKYEYFCKYPLLTLITFFEEFNIPYDKKSLLDFSKLNRHTLAGNLRFVKNIDGIYCSEEWKKKLNKYQKLQFYILAGIQNFIFKTKIIEKIIK